MKESSEVVLRISGKDVKYRMRAVSSEPERIKQSLARLLEAFPQDAPYYNIRMVHGRVPDPKDMDTAALNTVLVEAVAVH